MNNNTELMTFPCRFALKVVGQANDQFEIDVLSIVKKYVAYLDEQAISTRLSQDKNYLAMTITFTASSKEMLDKIYQDLTTCKSVLIAL